ncbi:MAG: isochorismate synthase [Acidimicrobiia bacterium]
MSAEITSTQTTLVARTAACAPLPNYFALLGAHGFVWRDRDVTFVTQGVTAQVPVDHVAAMLASIAISDPDQAGVWARPRAVGALPFLPGAPATLDIPTHTITRTADGRWFHTVVAPANAEVTPLIEPEDLSVEPGRFVVERATTPDAWTALVRCALQAIDADEITKVVLAREAMVGADAPFDAAQILQRLEAQNPACMIFAHATSDGVFLGASPELLVARTGTRVFSRPMAGTVPRATSVAADDAMDAALRTLKHEHEHALVVDAVCAALRAEGVVVESAAPEVVHLPTLAHLATAVTGTATDSVSALDLARALHPTPAVGGTPANAALAFIAAHEGFARNCYAGPVGWVDSEGDGAFAVALRCAEIRGTTARLIAGAGIVAGSEPESEWAETQAKLEPMLRALVRP